MEGTESCPSMENEDSRGKRAFWLLFLALGASPPLKTPGNNGASSLGHHQPLRRHVLGMEQFGAVAFSAQMNQVDLVGITIAKHRVR